MTNGTHPKTSITACSCSAHETQSIAGALADLLEPGDVVLLSGDLGAGKTTFVKGLARALGVTQTVTSPTFTLVRTYQAAPGAAAGDASVRAVRTLVHADLFRLENLNEVVDLAIAELLEPDAVAVVEWGDVALPVLGRDALEVGLRERKGEDERAISFELPPSWRERSGVLFGALAPWLSGGAGDAPRKAD